MLPRLLLARVRCPLIARPPRALLLLAASMAAGTRAAARQGLILGAFASDHDDQPSQLSDAGEAFDKQVNGKLKELLALSGPPLKKGKTRIFHGLHQVGGKYLTNLTLCLLIFKEIFFLLEEVCGGALRISC
ncbi:PREDICTED: cytosol aminopeptidase [Thamnophis sirtalis]|uniref:Cytosol aminopeptidase n=1 Tax=Thamnophis sirtalis TaxID=35019 RepID=A0A6I9Y783_9SAUR|nr:PREDICTED: cytosol aminopeptidase [Thamnophis sirtalis]